MSSKDAVQAEASGELDALISAIQSVEPGSGGCNDIDHDEAKARVLAYFAAHPAPTAEKALRDALTKAIPRLAEHLRMMRSENDPRSLQATNDLADAHAALLAHEAPKDQSQEAELPKKRI